MERIKLDECVVKDNINDMAFDKVTEMLAKAYWSIGIKKSEVVKGAENSALCVGVFYNNEQIGYARTVSDKTRFAYVMDVIVDENFRKQGIGQMMVKAILNHPSLKEVYHWMLITSNAHEVYKKVGFKLTSRANDLMEIRSPRPER